MILSSTRLTAGVRASATPENAGASGTFSFGAANSLSLPETFSKGHILGAIIVSDATATWDGTKFTGSASWVGGTAQVETFTAITTATASGDLTVTVSSARFADELITVPIYEGYTADDWAGAVRSALAAHETVSAFFTISGTGTAIVATAKPVRTHTVLGTAYPVYYGNDATLAIVVDSGTTGVSGGTSVNTTSGVATSGVMLFDCDELQPDGLAVTPYAEPGVVAIDISAESTGVTLSQTGIISALPLGPLQSGVVGGVVVLAPAQDVDMVLTGTAGATYSAYVKLTAVHS